MQDKDIIIQELIQRLGTTVSVPQATEISAAETESFSAELRKIYFDAFYVTDRKDYLYLKRWASLHIHPDKLKQTTNHRSNFTQSLSTAQSENIRSLPIQIFNEYIDYIKLLALEKDNISTALNSIPAFWTNNIQSYQQDASVEDKKRIDLHNKQVLFYLLYCMNSYWLNVAIDCLYKNYRYPKHLAMALTYLNAVLNFLLFAALIIPVITYLIQFGITEVLYGMERILLNLVTQGHYYAYVERQFCIAVGRGEVDINGDAPMDSDATVSNEISEEEAFIKGQSDLDKIVNEVYITLDAAFNRGDRGARVPIKDSIKHDLCSTYNRKNSHEQLVQKSLWNHFKQVFSLQSSWWTILWGVCRLAIASTIFLCLTIPLTVLRNTNLWVSLALEAIVLAAYLLIKAAVILLTALPVYIYDAALGQDRSSNANAIVLDEFTKDTFNRLKFFAKINDTPLGRNAQESMFGVFKERLGYGSAS